MGEDSNRKKTLPDMSWISRGPILDLLWTLLIPRWTRLESFWTKCGPLVDSAGDLVGVIAAIEVKSLAII